VRRRLEQTLEWMGNADRVLAVLRGDAATGATAARVPLATMTTLLSVARDTMVRRAVPAVNTTVL
jgi:hypothetical protein